MCMLLSDRGEENTLSWRWVGRSLVVALTAIGALTLVLAPYSVRKPLTAVATARSVAAHERALAPSRPVVQPGTPQLTVAGIPRFFDIVLDERATCSTGPTRPVGRSGSCRSRT